MKTCDGPTCDGLAVATVTTGCIREHINQVNICAAHLDVAKKWAAAANLWCSECGPPGQRTRARLRIEMHSLGGVR